jgi:hypothetical protein
MAAKIVPYSLPDDGVQPSRDRYSESSREQASSAGKSPLPATSALCSLAIRVNRRYLCPLPATPKLAAKAGPLSSADLFPNNRSAFARGYGATSNG